VLETHRWHVGPRESYWRLRCARDDSARKLPVSYLGRAKWGGYMTYQEAKVTNWQQYADAALITDDDGQGGVYLYLMINHSGHLLPFSRGWHPSEADAKKHCLETLGVHESHWRTEEGEAEWAPAIRAAMDHAIKRYQEGVERN
jgi:hypothetical protein